MSYFSHLHFSLYKKAIYKLRKISLFFNFILMQLSFVFEILLTLRKFQLEHDYSLQIRFFLLLKNMNYTIS